MKAFVNITGIFITLPIWYFLLYSILNAIHPDRLVWFLFWVYIPVGFVLSICQKIVEAERK